MDTVCYLIPVRQGDGRIWQMGQTKFSEEKKQFTTFQKINFVANVGQVKLKYSQTRLL